ncbi:MAG TPA: LITAF-like zinc ribbon domain-containing protein [Pyrinomonadaceae bacterium]|jgi:hypothetical protein
MIACQSCGSLNDEAARICRYCGKGLRGQATEQKEYVPPVQNWVNEAPPVPVYGGQVSTTGYKCPRCGTNYLPQVEKKISTEGWIVFAALLVFCLPLFWVGLMMKSEQRVCPVCHANLG